MSAMAKIWAKCLEAGTQTWDKVPDDRKDEVREILRADVESGKITAERYEEITGEQYEA